MSTQPWGLWLTHSTQVSGHVPAMCVVLGLEEGTSFSLWSPCAVCLCVCVLGNRREVEEGVSLKWWPWPGRNWVGNYYGWFIPEKKFKKHSDRGLLWKLTLIVPSAWQSLPQILPSLGVLIGRLSASIPSPPRGQPCPLKAVQGLPLHSYFCLVTVFLFPL